MAERGTGQVIIETTIKFTEGTSKTNQGTYCAGCPWRARTVARPDADIWCFGVDVQNTAVIFSVDVREPDNRPCTNVTIVREVR